VLGLLRQSLRDDPSILREALAGLEQAETRDREAAQARTLAERGDALFRDAADPVRGNPQGRVAMVEFFDARCGFCKQMHPVMEQLLARERDLRVVMKDLPILGPNSVLAARAMLAAQRQNGYVPLYDALMRLREDTTEPVLRREAERLRLDWPRLRREMEEPAVTGPHRAQRDAGPCAANPGHARLHHRHHDPAGRHRPRHAAGAGGARPRRLSARIVPGAGRDKLRRMELPPRAPHLPNGRPA
jgi:thiol-disulfide isomerase/thioredoxin